MGRTSAPGEAAGALAAACGREPHLRVEQEVAPGVANANQEVGLSIPARVQKTSLVCGLRRPPLEVAMTGTCVAVALY